MPEFRNTPPDPPITERDTEWLIEDLCIALRNVGSRLGWGPPDNQDIENIHNVHALSAELNKRGVELQPRLERLTEETGWLMPVLLEDCLKSPEKVPYVRERNGMRRSFQCPLCQQEEFPDITGIAIGANCLQEIRIALERPAPPAGVIFYRTYNTDKRCRHANDDTVLAVLDNEYDLTLHDAFCQQCINEELVRRQTLE